MKPIRLKAVSLLIAFTFTTSLAPCFAYDVSQFDLIALRFAPSQSGVDLRDLIQRYEFEQVGSGFLTASQYNAHSLWFSKFCLVEPKSDMNQSLWFELHRLYENTTDPRAVQLNNVGVCLLNSKDYDSAILAFDKALTFSPNYKIAKDNREIAKRKRATESKDLQDLYWKIYSDPGNADVGKKIDATIGNLGYDSESSSDRAYLGDAQQRAGNSIAALVEYRASLALKDDPKIRASFELLNANLNSPSNAFYDSAQQSITTAYGASANIIKGPARGANPNVQNNVDYSAYVNSVQESIKKNWIRFVSGRYSENHAKVYFQIGKEGNLINAKISESSGDAAADKAALDAVHASAPFHPLPKGSPASVDVLFSFEENIASSAKLKSEAAMSVNSFGNPIKFEDDLNHDRKTNLSHPNLHLVQLYALMLNEKILPKWNRLAAKNNKAIVILFRVLANGHVESIRIHQSCGDSRVDELARTTIKLSAPFAPLPANTFSPLDIEFWFAPAVQSAKVTRAKSNN